jgi:glyoxylase-like metal-dependent hydrolase (beta-lactamase superfamily II)
MLEARLAERGNLRPDQVTDVFLTSFRPETRRAITLFEAAAWWVSEQEREAVGTALALRLKKEAHEGEQADRQVVEALSQDVAILRRCKAAPDRLADHVDLFPMPGVTPGSCGLLLENPRFTTVVCGDAIPTIEHLEQGMVLTPAADVDQARASMSEAVEVADLLILGRDNVVVNPDQASVLGIALVCRGVGVLGRIPSRLVIDDDVHHDERQARFFSTALGFVRGIGQEGGLDDLPGRGIDPFQYVCTHHDCW